MEICCCMKHFWCDGEIWIVGKKTMQVTCWNIVNVRLNIKCRGPWSYFLCSVTKQLTIPATMRKMRMLKQKTPVIVLGVSVCTLCMRVGVFAARQSCWVAIRGMFCFLPCESRLYRACGCVSDSHCACVTGSICAAC